MYKHLYALFGFILLNSAIISQNACQVPDAIVVESFSYGYSPQFLQIEVGQSVSWVNIGGNHDVQGITNSITNQPYNNPEEFEFPSVFGNSNGVCIGTFTFTIPGIYNYDCSIGNHALNGMVGQVIVGTGGCTDPSAINYDPEADFDLGNCIFGGCTDPAACNYDPQEINDDGSCTYPGCTDQNAVNYDQTAGCDDGLCLYYANDCPADLDSDLQVNVVDLLIFLQAFGSTCQ